MYNWLRYPKKVSNIPKHVADIPFFFIFMGYLKYELGYLRQNVVYLKNMVDNPAKYPKRVRQRRDIERVTTNPLVENGHPATFTSLLSLSLAFLVLSYVVFCVLCLWSCVLCVVCSLLWLVAFVCCVL